MEFFLKISNNPKEDRKGGNKGTKNRGTKQKTNFKMTSLTI